MIRRHLPCEGLFLDAGNSHAALLSMVQLHAYNESREAMECVHLYRRQMEMGKGLRTSPGRALTYHLHERRDEARTVIEGRGWVKLDGNEFAVAEGQTVRIPKGAFHTIRAETLLKVMEIQTGEDIDAEDKIIVWVG